ncbi:hypothetical protein HPB50_006244 [Hyalomma asiaticum]|uniref:Uncharacterized protein n=1 Tax=Hyalomma asiaticum TaxID=266040 RepID=A0ACB7TFQ2_HYAAI|nr:hypothetical protein HPB50_006244 [Hyalomma asiaticum]
MSTEVSNLARAPRKKMKELKCSLEFTNKEFETLKQECTGESGNAALKASLEVPAQEVRAPKKQLLDTSLKVTAQDQWSGNKNIEIMGILSEKTEMLFQMPQKAGRRTG